mgnify:CR=1 FL=1
MNKKKKKTKNKSMSIFGEMNGFSGKTCAQVKEMGRKAVDNIIKNFPAK